MKDEESVDEGVEVTETTPESTGSDEAKDKATPERVGFRGWLRGTAQKVAGQGLRNVGAGVVNNVIWTAGNATKIAGSVLQRSGNAGFKDYQSLATHLESLIQMDKGKARIESVTYLSELLKSKAPNYESLASVQSKDVGSPAPVLVINDNAGADAPSSPQAKGAGAAVDESPAETPEPPFSLEDNPLKSLASVSVPAQDIPESALESEKEKHSLGVREVFLSSKALELAGMALMKSKPASWENAAYRDLFQACVLLDPTTKDDYCESLLKTASVISEVWETVHIQSNEGSDATTIRETVEKMMEIVCDTIFELQYEHKLEALRRKIDALVTTEPGSASSEAKSDAFLREKESVRVARELCDLVEEEQKLVETLVSKDNGEQREETQRFLAVKTIELTDDLSEKSNQIKDAADQKGKAQKYREKKLNDLTGALSQSQNKRDDLKEREEKLKQELEMVNKSIVKEEAKINDLSEEIKLVEESSADVIGSLTFTESELKVRHNILAASLKAMDSVQDFFSDFCKSDSGWSESHGKALVGLANNDSHQTSDRLFRACVSHLELCVQEGDRLLKKIQFCDNELKTMINLTVQMESLGMMDGEGEEDDLQDNIQEMRQAQRDKATTQLEVLIDDGLKTQAILDSEGIRDINNIKLKMLIDRMNDFTVYLRGTKLKPAEAEAEERAAVEASASPHAEPRGLDSPERDNVSPDEDKASEYIEYLEQKLNPEVDIQKDYQVMLTNENEDDRDKEPQGDEGLDEADLGEIAELALAELAEPEPEATKPEEEEKESPEEGEETKVEEEAEGVAEESAPESGET